MPILAVSFHVMISIGLNLVFMFRIKNFKFHALSFSHFCSKITEKNLIPHDGIKNFGMHHEYSHKNRTYLRRMYTRLFECLKVDVLQVSKHILHDKDDLFDWYMMKQNNIK